MNSEISKVEAEDQFDLLPWFLIALGVGILCLFATAKRRPAQLSFRQLRRNISAGRLRAAAATRAADGTFLADSLLKSWTGIFK